MNIKHPIALAACCCLLLALTACNTKGGDASGGDSSQTSAPTDEAETIIQRDPDISRNAWLEEEIEQLWQEGYDIDVTAYKSKAAMANGDKTEEEKLYYEMLALPMRADYPYKEPSDYESIMEQVSPSMGFVENPSNSEMDDRFYGAWLGRFIGSALGMPIEMWMPEKIRTWYEKADAWPLDNYVPTTSRAAQEDGIQLNSLTTTLDNIHEVPSDDDTRYTVLNLQVLRLYNITWDTWDLGSIWLWSLPFRMLCTAERTAYLNFACLDDNYMGGKPANYETIVQKSATYMNPYREWIGAQIRADIWGYAFAGDPRGAAKIAYKDAALTHVKNGIYGEMYIAAMIAASFGEKDVEKLVERAMAEIPQQTRLYEAVTKTRDFVKENKNPDEIISFIRENWGNYNVIHTIPNAAICTAAVLYGEGDFEKALTFTAMAGHDTDCNCATVGSIMGAYCGAEKIPGKWKNVISDHFNAQISGFEDTSITALARETKLQWEIYGE
ncbi:MAG TPA: ADP-ribosylglycohydrolase family protein [Firmicutes bacterium]|nr:ADP-ribosylglycohydrolase family protein [Bacillota bacterium]